jgi:hypothetical protein
MGTLDLLLQNKDSRSVCSVPQWHSSKAAEQTVWRKVEDTYGAIQLISATDEKVSSVSMDQIPPQHFSSTTDI